MGKKAHFCQILELLSTDFSELLPEYDISRSSPNSYVCFLCFLLSKISWADNTVLNQNHAKLLIKLHLLTIMTNLSLSYHQIMLFLFMIVIKTMMKLRYLTKYMNLYFKFTIEFWTAVGLSLLFLFNYWLLENILTYTN